MIRAYAEQDYIMGDWTATASMGGYDGVHIMARKTGFNTEAGAEAYLPRLRCLLSEISG